MNRLVQSHISGSASPHHAGASMAPIWFQYRRSLKAAKTRSRVISRMEWCRTHHCPAHSALRFSWADGLLVEAEA